MFDTEKINELISLYVIPWSINIVTALLIFIIGRIVISILIGILGKVMGRTKLDSILIEFTQTIAKVLLLIFVIVAALDQLGVNTTSLIAVLGAAGLAIGLALQGSLQNFAAGFLLLVLRPFKAGDYVEAAGTAGMVEKISIFSTILRTPDNKEVTVPNGSIYSDNIVNYSARDTRRVDMVFGISYGDDLKKAKEVMMAALTSDERVLEDPAPNVAVSALADSSVNFIVRPWVKTEDYWPVYWDMTEKIKVELEANGMSIPFPQRDLHIFNEKA
ncbi:mechanosensitive ion channel family protein [Marinimicrobium koreense]|uniref:Small-conductance mechanosensitive channel n=1 Tax=Marinimicrobium koreense TaxID=306545 RepID=A0A3N1NW34_9GAMM|nr:mechanosensitive ion channel domain-containing protein [Marinimicrobium koreense]ROQ19448.1 small conductance mechanosensitive channel [Marinimicrobium koreense]